MRHLLSQSLMYVPRHRDVNVQAELRAVLFVMVTLLSLGIPAHCHTSVLKEHVSGTLFPTTVWRNERLRVTGSNRTNEGKFTVTTLQEISELCPGAAGHFKDRPVPTLHRVSVSNCARPEVDPRSQHGVVYGVCNDSTTFCQFVARVPTGMTVRAIVQQTQPPCYECWEGDMYCEWSRWATHLSSKWPVSIRGGWRINCIQPSRQSFLSSSNEMAVLHYNNPLLQIQFLSVLGDRLRVVRTSNFSGFVTSVLLDGRALFSNRDIRSRLTVPRNHVVMISFEIFKINIGCFKSIHLLWREEERTGIEYQSGIEEDYERTIKILHTERLEIRMLLSNRERKDFENMCLKMLFSFHHESKLPQRLDSGLYNCSADNYQRFRQHLDCNLKVECEDGRDETGHCPFSSPACQGLVASGSKCYKLFSFPKADAKGSEECQKHGMKIASIKTNQELTDFQKTFGGRRHFRVLIGITSGLKSLPFMYRRFYIWSDNTVLYNTNHITFTEIGKIGLRDHYYVNCNVSRIYYGCHTQRMAITVAKQPVHVMCEKYVQNEDFIQSGYLKFPAAHKHSLNFTRMKQALVKCGEGHVTHAFLSCDPKSRCGLEECTLSKAVAAFTSLTVVHSTSSIRTLFTCSTDEGLIPFTLLCDLRPDCQDGSDESFCQHQLCHAFVCSNGQCVALDKRCDDQADCLDSSDESGCPVVFNVTDMPVLQQRLLINLDGQGYFTQTVMNINESCPDTHYSCRAEWVYCLPVYTRCNGYNDCVYHEDERDCDGWVCPELYRCRGSTVCVHVDHMCDGWPQCPQRDDEWLCDMTCPAQCLCQGYAFLCSRPFSAHLFPQIRYLDAHGSGIAPSHLTNNTYLVYLSLARSFISSLSDMGFPNLQFLDLSHNHIRTIVISKFSGLVNLLSLSLQGNPVTEISSETSNLRHHPLQRMDLSRTCLIVFDSQSISYFSKLEYVNLSFSSIQFIGPGGFQSLSHLKELDLRGNLVDSFPADMFRGLNRLSLVLSSHYRLCCKSVIPNIFSSTKCIAPQHFLSSCENMIHSKVYRLSFWFVATCASLGNVICGVGQYVSKNIHYGREVTLFLASLHCAHFCTGIYMGVIAAAHETFRGQYTHYEDKWKDSVACKVAGVLSLLSSEVSVISIFLLTLDYLFNLSLTAGRFRFSIQSAAVACGVAWLLGITLSSLPLLSVLSQWGHYGQTAVCSLMLHDRHQSTPRLQFFDSVLIFNSIICLIVFVGQTIVYRLSPKPLILINSSINPACVSAGLLMRIAVPSVLCWFSLFVSRVLSLAGVVVSEKFSLAMTVVVLPFNSVITPVLYLSHAVTCKWKREQEERLLRVLKSRIKFTRK